MLPAFQWRVTSRRRTLAALVAMVLLLAATPWVSADTFTNPIAPRGADPWVVQWQGQYFHTRTVGGSVRVWRSPYLQSINTNAEVVWDPPADALYGQNLWAPELHRVNGKWYLYVAADDGHDINHRMYVLEGDSQDPQGSYTFKGQISIPDDRWGIDGTVLEHGDKDYFIWSARTFSTDTIGSQSLYIAEMSDPWTLTGERVRISTPIYAWERQGHSVNEGPQVLRNDDGDVLLTYSASGFYTPGYAVGALTLIGDDPLNPAAWSKHPQPLFDAGNGVEGTGHASFVKSPDGTENWIVYHARTEPGAARDLRIQPFTFGPDGLPQFGEPIATGEATPAPSGVPVVTFVPNLSFERGGEGWIDEFHAAGDAGVVANDGEEFGVIAGGDGSSVAYLGVGDDSALYQDIGPLREGAWTLGVSLAISDDDVSRAADNPAAVVLQLESIGLHPGGSANEEDKLVLARLVIDSDELSDVFRDFDVTAIIEDGDLVGTWLRVAVYTPGALATDGSPWRVKLDHLTLEHVPAAALVPEPSAAALFLLGVATLGTRADRPIHRR